MKFGVPVAILSIICICAAGCGVGKIRCAGDEHCPEGMFCRSDGFCAEGLPPARDAGAHPGNDGGFHPLDTSHPSDGADGATDAGTDDSGSDAGADIGDDAGTADVGAHDAGQDTGSDVDNDAGFDDTGSADASEDTGTPDAGCSSTCPQAGLTECAGPTEYRICADGNGDDCVEWSVPLSCGSHAACENNACACDANFGNCNDSWTDGCEADLLSDPEHCWTCVTNCGADSVCVTGTCSCPAGFENCDKQWTTGCEVNTVTDKDNCGSCGDRCNQNAHCANSACECDSGYQNCDTAWGNGCEINTDADSQNCAVCGRKCIAANASPGCVAAACYIASCIGAFRNCDGIYDTGCEADSATDPQNCGGCGDSDAQYKCTTKGWSGVLSYKCQASVCLIDQCSPGRTKCKEDDPAGCVDLATDQANCGACNSPCSANNWPNVSSYQCQASACKVGSCAAGTGNCDAVDSNGCETNTDTNADHCGVCAKKCEAANATAVCGSGNCQYTCINGFDNCDANFDNGCESNLRSEATCGTCTNVCLGGQVCQNGTCNDVQCTGPAECPDKPNFCDQNTLKGYTKDCQASQCQYTVVTVEACTGLCVTDVCCNTRYYEDKDADGYGNDAVSQFLCAPQAGWVTQAGDCADDPAVEPLAAQIHPGVPEVCDGKDNDCNTKTDAADPALVLTNCEKQDGVCAGKLHTAAKCPGGVWQACDATEYGTDYGPEVCDTKDNDCNAQPDDGVPPPVVPTQLGGTGITPSRVQLNWTDNATDETEFEVFRTTDTQNWPGSPSKTVAAHAGTGGMTVVDAGLDASTTYYYKVRAKNPCGTSDFTSVGSATTQAPSSNWLGDYLNRVRVTVNSPADLTDYQVRTQLNTAALITAGKLKPDCADIRATAEDGITELPFYVEEGYCNLTTTGIWLKAPQLFTGNNYFYIYYNDALGTSASNGVTAMIGFGFVGEERLISANTFTTCTINPSENNSVWCWGNAWADGLGNQYTGGHTLCYNHASSYAILDYFCSVSPVVMVGDGNAIFEDVVGLSGKKGLLSFGGFPDAIDDRTQYLIKRNYQVWNTVLAFDGESGPQILSMPGWPQLTTGANASYFTTGYGNGYYAGAVRSHLCYLSPEHAAFCKGSNPWGQLGVGTVTDSSTWVQVKSPDGFGYLTGVSQIEAGYKHGCGLTTDGNVFCWGDNTYKQLGDGSAVSYSTLPVQVCNEDCSGFLSNIVEISSSGYHTCAIKSTGDLYCWGYGANGRLGNGLTANQSKPVWVNFSNPVHVSAGVSHTCAVNKFGELFCWGYGGNGKIGANSTSDKLWPTQEQGAETDWVHVTAGYHTTCAAKKNGTIWCWGNNTYGQLSDGTQTDRWVPTQVVHSDLNYNKASIAAGYGTTWFVSNQNAVWGWGMNYTSFPAPNGIYGGATSNKTVVRASHNSGCAKSTGNQLYCWGDNTYQQQKVTTLTTVSEFSVGNEHACAGKADGTVWCAGNTFQGRLGNGTTTGDACSGSCWNNPVQVKSEDGLGTLANVSKVSTGYQHTCAVKNDGATMWCWGNNNYGQLANTGVSGYTTLPVVSNIAGPLLDGTAGFNHTCAVKADGTAWCWGRNNNGQLGNNSDLDSGDPVQVSGLANASKIWANQNHTCALKSDATVWCWGRNSAGQLGNDSQIDSWVPVQVVGRDGVGLLQNVVEVATGLNHTCARDTTGAMYCWGQNSNGALGDLTTTNSDVPKLVRNIWGESNEPFNIGCRFDKTGPGGIASVPDPVRDKYICRKYNATDPTASAGNEEAR
jgi:alpha-tubulin suppressor-like RCC1 family protein